ncbi:hypothetical protein NECAME_05753 [Necator americanus]|uniref:Uncharacterized protein n=1 Tax=Necator americanus TaxID=51031 RepID=W2U0Z2_NECAM|nr:hypothetical protein NECAME_05753 [Necator americanus]ETN87031.1 hypothetical protein NECAME_05753 [Necator americanus]
MIYQYQYNQFLFHYFSEGDGVRRRARTVGPLGRENMPQATHTFYALVITTFSFILCRSSYATNRVLSIFMPMRTVRLRNAPVASHTVRRTPISFDRGANFAYDRDGVTQGVVSNQVRRWPPVSNATGAEVNKNDWVKELTRDDDGLITTMARSKSQGVIERKVEDNWKWHDNQGQLLDEKNQKTWRVIHVSKILAGSTTTITLWRVLFATTSAALFVLCSST